MSAGHELYATDETFREVADLLFGDGADLIVKMNPTQSDVSARKKKERTQAQVGLASNVVGIAAGTAGLHEAARGFKATKYQEKHGTVMPEKTPKTKAGGKLKALKGKYAVPVAAGAVGLQAANLGGDFVSNRVLARSAKKPDKVKKDLGEVSEMATTHPKKHITRAAVTNAPRAAGKGLEYSKVAHGQLKKLPDKVGTKKVSKSGASSEDVDVVWSGEIAKANMDKQQLFGWASVVEVNGEPVVDLQGDVISPEEMEKAGYSYVMKSRKGGDMHLRDNWSPIQKSEMIESFIVTPEKREAMGLPESVPTGWWVGFQVQDSDVWAKVKSGERTGFSIHGTGKRTPS